MVRFEDLRLGEVDPNKESKSLSASFARLINGVNSSKTYQEHLRYACVHPKVF